jgi:uncharacterized protein YyaL (SSP411 family)
MERESFEDAETAELMNQLFVSVKVDREERPDIDRLYMDFVVRTGGHGGWPLHVFCTPEGQPFYGGTYFPPQPRQGMPSFRQVLEAAANAYRTRRGEVEENARRVVEALSLHPTGVASQPPGATTLATVAARLRGAADRSAGGFGEAPKFPTPTSLEALLAATEVLPKNAAEEALEHVAFTCREMSRRGLYDHLGGGFHRYCVDARWTVPHFEKMLYDQAQLIRVYAETWRRSGCDDEDLLWPIRETLDYLRREMAAPDGGFFASQDADSEGEEGRFYVWTPADVTGVLGAERGEAFCRAYGVGEPGNFAAGASVLADTLREPRGRFRSEREALRKAREQRVAPGTDRKLIASWNAYLISGLARTASLLEDEAMLRDAETTADFVLERMVDAEGRLLHVFDAGRAHVLGFLEDVAGMFEASLDLHRAGAGERFLAVALGLAEQVMGRFWDEAEDEIFLTPSDGERLVHRPRSEPDGATPHSAGLAALGLLRAATLAAHEGWQSIVERVLRRYAFMLDQAPEAYPTLARVAALAERGLCVAVVVGTPTHAATHALAQRARRVLRPEDAVVVVEPGVAPRGVAPTWLEGRDALEGRPTAYVCRGTTCSLPITEPDALTPLASPKREEH